MKSIIYTFSTIIVFIFISNSQALSKTIKLDPNWKFKAGDHAEWANPDYDDSNWQIINVNDCWENQGHQNYDGFGWYRMKVVIPSSLKESAFLKDSIQFILGKADDDDQFYLNGTFIGQNNRKHKTSDYDFQNGNGFYIPERKYILAADDPAIKWDEENVIAVRIFDQGGGGGLYAGNASIEMADIARYFVIDKKIDYYHFEQEQVNKSFFVKNQSTVKINGNLSIQIQFDESGKNIDKGSFTLSLSPGESFQLPVSFEVPNESTRITFTFKHDDSNQIIQDFEEVPYLLTPPTADEPQICGAKVYGAKTGNPFSFTIPTTGIRPMTFDAKDLPEGLKLDENTGIISGVIQNKGTYEINLSAKNRKGETSSVLTIKAGNLLALTPPMGWNSYNCWGNAVNQQEVLKTAQAFVESGLINHGWTYINIDDGWQTGRNASGEIVPNERFPNIQSMIDSIHAMGLKFGIYSSPGPTTCGGFPASYEHEFQDAKTYAEWEVDFLKYDWCSYSGIAKDNSLSEMKKPYIKMQKALNAVKRDIVYSLCQYGMGDVWKWGAEVDGNLWRTTGDITDQWEVVCALGFAETDQAQYARPGHWNDPDMLTLGWVGWGTQKRPVRLTFNEQYAHFSLWCLLAAPLLAGNDMTRLDDFTMNLLTNDEVIAINQDPLGNQATRFYSKGQIQVWMKTLGTGEKAIGIFNMGDEIGDASVHLSELGLAGEFTVRDIWKQKDLFTTQDKIETKVPNHGVKLFKLSSIQ